MDHFDSLGDMDEQPLRRHRKAGPPPLVNQKTKKVDAHSIRKLEKYSLDRDVKNLATVEYKDRLYVGRAHCKKHVARENLIEARSPFIPPPFVHDVKCDPFKRKQSLLFITSDSRDQSLPSVEDTEEDTSDDENDTPITSDTSVELTMQKNKVQNVKELVQQARMERRKKLAAHAKKQLEAEHGLQDVDCYWGTAGRLNFFRTAGAVHAAHQHLVQLDTIEPNSSPRTQYLTTSSQKRRMLEPLLMRAEYTPKIDLSGRGLVVI
jgi:hypothetical protein